MRRSESHVKNHRNGCPLPLCGTGRYKFKFNRKFNCSGYGAQLKLAATKSKSAPARDELFLDYTARDACAGISRWVGFVVVSRGVDYDSGATGLK